MSQTDSNIKTKSKRSISRDFVPREVDIEEKLIQENQIFEKETITDRREFLRQVVPSTGNAVAALLRNVGAVVGSISEELKSEK